MIFSDVKKMLSIPSQAKIIKTFTGLNSFVIDRVYKLRTRINPLPLLAVKELSVPIQAIFMSKRGGNPVLVQGGDASFEYYEPQPLNPYQLLTGAEINNWKLFEATSKEAAIASKIDINRKIIRVSTELMAAQSMTGTINYPIKTDDGTDVFYKIVFGNTLSYTATTKWDATEKKFAQMLSDLRAVSKLIKKSGYGKIEWWVSSTAFDAIAAKVEALQNDSRINAKVDGEKIKIGTIELLLVDEENYNPQSKSFEPVVAAGKICAFATEAPFELVYSALDDLSSGLKALPMFSKAREVDDKIKIISESKPTTVPYVKSICWMTVL